MMRYCLPLVLLFLISCRTTQNQSTSKEIISDASVEGQVILEEDYGSGSHSSAPKVVLLLSTGEKLQLRKVGENSFETPESRMLLDKTVVCTGNIIDSRLLLYTSCEEVMYPSGSPDAIWVSGYVVVEEFAEGSHSQSQRVFLETAPGDRVLIRRDGENTFELPETRNMVGYRVRCLGRLAGSVFIYSQCEYID